MTIDPSTHIGHVHLQVRSLDRSIPFYTDVIGFKLQERHNSTASFTADGERVLLALDELPSATPKPRYSTGLYHFAILVPSRAELARSLLQLARVGYPLDGASDHAVSEALYLSDPDGNGIEIYADRPREEWTYEHGHMRITTDPLDLDSILAEIDPKTEVWQGLKPATTIGHIHLHVASIESARDFYHGLLGFDVILRSRPGALFVSAGGYHHHIGLNTWIGEGAPPPPPNAVGLKHFEVVVPDTASFQAVLDRLRAAGYALTDSEGACLVQDPSGNGVLITAAR